jgi:hypothetical protein
MMNCEGFGRKQSRPNFKVLSRHSPKGTEKNMKTLSQDSRSPGRDLSLGPPEYEAAMLTTGPHVRFAPHVTQLHLEF